MTRRVGMLCRMRPELRDEYLALHAAVWPQVEATITACGIRDFTIWSHGDVLVASFSYVGDDYEADQARMAADPTTQAWWARTAPCQVPFDDGLEPGATGSWQLLDEVWHLD